MDYNVTHNFNTLFTSTGENSYGTFYPTISEINIDQENTGNLTLIDVDKLLNEIFSPYPDKDEIPVLKITNENCFFNDIKIIPSHLSKSIFVDNIFNKCKNHDNNDNEYYCKICKKNICKECSNNCKNNAHNLINLKDYKMNAEINKTQIQKFLSKVINDSKKNNNPSYFSFIFVLIQAIIKKDYNNYFHYQNINECHSYLQIYEEIYNNSFLNILYAINEDINNKEKDYKIFGKTFVENNKNKIYLIINGIKFPLSETIKINDNDKLIKVILIKKSDKIIEDLSYMFCNCLSKSINIFEIEERTKFLENVTNISNMFKNCSYLTKMDLHFLHIFQKLNRIDSLFSGCEEITDIVNLTHLNTTYVTKMDRIFNSCNKLKKIDGIDKFDTNNVETFDEMFKDCSLLVSLPKDISKWKMGKAKSFKRMFKGCSKLIQLPDLSGWNKENVLKIENLKGMFDGCSALENLPDIGLWNVENVKTMKKMFKGCSSLMELPKNIVYWNVKNVRNMEKMFSGCEQLAIANLPDLKKWNLENLKKMDKMFFGCNFLINREKIKIDNIFNIKNIEPIYCEKILEKKKI